MELLQSYVDEVILRALHEDITGMDITSDFLLDEAHESDAYLMAKDEGVLCGMEIAERVFALAGEGVSFTAQAKDGDRVKYGDILATMHGKTRTLLKGERTALNLLQHLSGIATETRRCVDIVAGTNASIADTRKCMVGIRAMQKYAVRCGGGKNHRFNLSDGAMLKDNHIDACGGILPAITQLRQQTGLTVRDLQEVFGFNTPQAIYRWQRGLTLPTVDNLVVLAAVFGTTLDAIVVRTDIAGKIRSA